MTVEFRGDVAHKRKAAYEFDSPSWHRTEHTQTVEPMPSGRLELSRESTGRLGRTGGVQLGAVSLDADTVAASRWRTPHATTVT